MRLGELENAMNMNMNIFPLIKCVNYFLYVIIVVLFFSNGAWAEDRFEFVGFSGKILDSKTSSPLNGVEVVVTWSVDVVSFPQAGFGGYIHMARSQTGKDGVFTFPSSGILSAPLDGHVRLTPGAPTVWIYHDKYRPKIESLNAVKSNIGIPFLNRRVYASVSSGVSVALDPVIDVRHELHDLSSIMRSAKGFFEVGACGNPVVRKFAEKILGRQHELISRVVVVYPWEKRTFECNGKIYDYYDYYGYYECNSEHTKCNSGG